jgi:peptide/nickel transport system substrate-binding protein
MENESEGTQSPSRPESPGDPQHALTRRALFGTVFGGVSTVAILKTAEDRFGGGSGSNDSTKALGQTRGEEHASPASGTPLASPVASPAASPEPVPEATPDPNVYGELRIIRGDQFEYDTPPRESDTLTMVIAGELDNLNFSPAAFRQDFQITSSYLDPLVWSDDVTMEPVPWLAETWKWDDTGRRITFTLRDDVQWHDGDPLHADDVAFSLEVYRDDVDSGVRNLFTQLEFTETVDPRTLRVNLLTPDGNWLLNAASQLIFQRKQYIDHWESRPVGQRTLSDFSWESETPVGTGPWSIVRVRSVRIELERNNDYFAGPPHFRELHLGISGNREERIAAWVDGDLDLLSHVSAAELPAVQDVPAKLYASNGPNVMFAAFNFDNLTRAFPGLLQDVRIRRALSLAVDRQQYIDTVFSSFTRGFAAGTVAQPWAHDPEIESPRQNLDEARSLLEEAGLTDLNNDGLLEDFNGAPLAFSAIVRDDANPLLIQLLDGLIDDFTQLGVQMTVRVLAPEDFYTSWTSLRDYDFIAYSYALYPGFTDYDLYGSNFDIRINPQGWNPGGYDNEDVDDYIRRILISTDHDRQREMLVRLQQAVNDDLFGLWFGFPDDLVLVRNDIQGFQPNKYLSTRNTRLLWRDEGIIRPID